MGRVDKVRLVLVSVSLYHADDVVDDVNWIPNKHYSGVYGLLKLVLPKLLPVHIERVSIFLILLIRQYGL